jgi:hypothetical protein
MLDKMPPSIVEAAPLRLYHLGHGEFQISVRSFSTVILLIEGALGETPPNY